MRTWIVKVGEELPKARLFDCWKLEDGSLYIIGEPIEDEVLSRQRSMVGGE